MQKKNSRLKSRLFVERVKGIEPSCSAWKADVLPLNYTRIFDVAKRIISIKRVLVNHACGKKEIKMIKCYGRIGSITYSMNCKVRSRSRHPFGVRSVQQQDRCSVPLSGSRRGYYLKHGGLDGYHREGASDRYR